MADTRVLSFGERLCAACGEMSNPKLDSTNPHFGNKFASLLAVSDTVRPALVKYGLAYRQSVEEVGTKHYVFTYVYGFDSDHSLAEKVLATVPVTVDSNPQKMGSALTYAKRYCLLAAFGLVGDEDDDAEAASHAAPSKPKRASKPKEPASKAKAVPNISDEEKAELGQIASLHGDKHAVWAAYKANGIEGARALVELAPEKVDLFDADVEF